MPWRRIVEVEGAGSGDGSSRDEDLDRPAELAARRPLTHLAHHGNPKRVAQRAGLVGAVQLQREPDSQAVPRAWQVRRPQSEHPPRERALRPPELDEAPHLAEDEAARAGAPDELPYRGKECLPGEEVRRPAPARWLAGILRRKMPATCPTTSDAS